MDIAKLSTFDCPLEATLSIIGGKYKIIIIYFLMNRTLRYHELQKCISQATPKMLSQQLKELERDNIVKRVLYPVIPPKTEYSLTDLGKSLYPIVISIYHWGEQLFINAGVSNPCSEEDIKRLAAVSSGIKEN